MLIIPKYPKHDAVVLNKHHHFILWLSLAPRSFKVWHFSVMLKSYGISEYQSLIRKVWKRRKNTSTLKINTNPNKAKIQTRWDKNELAPLFKPSLVLFKGTVCFTLCLFHQTLRTQTLKVWKGQLQISNLLPVCIYTHKINLWRTSKRSSFPRGQGPSGHVDPQSRVCLTKVRALYTFVVLARMMRLAVQPFFSTFFVHI